MAYEQRKRTWAQQQMLQDLRDTQQTESVYLDMPRWARWIADVTDYSNVHATCVWNGKEVFIDAESPYVTAPDPSFPVERCIGGFRFYHAWPVSTDLAPDAHADIEAGFGRVAGGDR